MVLATMRGAPVSANDPAPAPTPQTGPTAAAGPAVPRRLTLAEATDRLIANNLAAVAARYNVDIMRAQRIAAGLRPGPSLTVSATQFAVPSLFHHPRFFIETDPVSAANTTYTIEVDQLIERGGKRELRAQQAELNTQVAEAQVRDVLRQQIFQLRQAFLGAVLARENLRVAQDNLGHFDQTERILRTQVNEGYTAGVDLKRLALQQLEVQREVAAAEQSYQQAARDVLNLIGEGSVPSSASSQFINTSDAPGSAPALDSDLDIIDGNLDVVPTLLWVDDLRKMAIANRPDIKAAEIALQAAQTGLALARAQRARDITIGGQYARTGSDNTVGVMASVPLAVGRRADAAIAQAVAAQAQAEAQLRQVRAQALTDVEKAFTAYRASRDRLRLFTSGALRAASDVRRIEEIAYRDGAKGLLDFLDAQRAYNQTLLDYNQARYDFLLSLYQIECATGTTVVK